MFLSISIQYQQRCLICPPSIYSQIYVKYWTWKKFWRELKKNSCEIRAYKMKIEVLEGNITPYSPNSHTTDRFFKILGLAFVCLSGIKVCFPSSFSRMFFFKSNCRINYDYYIFKHWHKQVYAHRSWFWINFDYKNIIHVNVKNWPMLKMFEKCTSRFFKSFQVTKFYKISIKNMYQNQ